MQGCRPSTALMGAAQCLAVDGDHAGELESIGLGEGRHEAPEREFKGFRLEQTEHPAEPVVARYAVFQTKEEPQQSFLRPSELLHLGALPTSAHNRGQRDEQRLQQIVPRIAGTRVRQLPKGLPEPLHPTPTMIRESSSESVLPSKAIVSANPYAIPLAESGERSTAGAHEMRSTPRGSGKPHTGWSTEGVRPLSRSRCTR